MMMLSVIFIITVILTKELVMATEQCSKYQFKSPFYPGESCEDIYNKNPESHDKSGYYWILDGPTIVYCGMTYTGSSCEDIYINNPETGDKSGYYRINVNQWKFCNMTEIAYNTPTCFGVGGGWRRITNINITAGGNCPSGWTRATVSGVSFCQKSFDGAGCSSTVFPVNGIHYQRVCGRARGYQKGHPNGFISGQTIDGHYVDGLSITYDSPRQHIWTYVTGSYESSCPCSTPTTFQPSFVGNSHYCESGRDGLSDVHGTYHFDDPLWDGSGCITSNCCDRNQPWFYHDLSGTATSNIEARICDSRAFSSGFTLIDQLELYVQ
ncbi:uncharacterized protein [Dysidea avara]|uniref:uncharacterized protein n=1 Tax=Dysidea avara TaxID=196820 RepID=UPI003323CC4B